VELHPDLEPVRFLVGSWRGSGHGQYPTIEPFSYTEEASFGPGPGKPFLLYIQRTRADDGAPLHSETGYLRMTPDGPELVIAQPTGLAEVHSGRQDGPALEFRSSSVQATSTAKAVGEVVRRLSVSGDELSYTLDMAYADVPLMLHLEATLSRVDT
jgi:hypothetical protein